MTLYQKQTLFAQLLAKLIQHIFEAGYECTIGEVWRTPEQAAANAAKGIGIKNSVHCERLAVDVNLFKNGVYLTATEDYAPIGAWWKTLGEDCRWGGDFTSRPDGNHFSIENNGIA